MDVPQEFACHPRADTHFTHQPFIGFGKRLLFGTLQSRLLRDSLLVLEDRLARIDVFRLHIA